MPAENIEASGLHVLLIGIDDYRDESLASLASGAMNVGLLAEWWRERYFNPAAPLASMEVVTSASGSSAPGPTSAESIAEAICRWHERATSHPENTAVFYFCGHGVETSAGPCLMASDLTLNAKTSAPRDQAFLVEPLLDAFDAGPLRQLWMFDTSRTLADTVALNLHPRPILVKSFALPLPVQRLVLYGAQRGANAYERVGQASNLVQAFLDTVDTGPRPLDTATLAAGVAARVERAHPELKGGGVEIRLTSAFELLGDPARRAETVGGTMGASLESLQAASTNRSAQQAPYAPFSLSSPQFGFGVPDGEAQRRVNSLHAAPTDESAQPQSPRLPPQPEPDTPDRDTESESDPLQAAPAVQGRTPVPQEPVLPRSPRPDLEFHDDDAEREVDTLGRGALAVVVARRLHAIWRKSNPPGATPPSEDRSAFVMHIDAPWGGGKTTFANFISRALNPYGYGPKPAGYLRDRYGEQAGLAAIFVADPPTSRQADTNAVHDAAAAVEIPAEHRLPWIIVEYNAWRMEHTSPPWWPFYQVIRKGCFGAIRREGISPADTASAVQPARQPLRNLRTWAGLWARELGWRLWTPKLIVPLLGFLISAMVVFLLWQFDVIASHGEAGKEQVGLIPDSWPARIMAGLGALTVIGGAVSLVMESLVPGVDPLAERLGLGRSDPLERFRTHFQKTICQLRRPVLVVVDDLDRCKPAVIVDLVRGMQTILRSPRVVFLVLGDRNWLECAFEAVHKDMSKVVGGVEQSVGARFVEKAIQLSFLLPGLDSARQSAFVAGLLRGGVAAAAAMPGTPAADLRAAARDAARSTPSAAFDAGELRASVLQTQQGQDFLAQMGSRLQQTGTPAGPADAEAEARRQAAQIVNEEIAIQAAAAPSIEAETAKRLEPLAPWLPGNPRQIKRILNGIALYHAAGLQHPTFSIARRWVQLALWVVLMTEWPATWRLLCACPELGDILCDPEPLAALARTDARVLPGSRAATEREVQRILNSTELMALIAATGGRTGDRLDTEAVRELLTLTPPNAKLPRLMESDPNTDTTAAAKAKTS